MKPSFARRLAPLALVSALFFTACANGAPPPGPIDIVRGMFDRNYDYRRGTDYTTDTRACSSRDLACTRDGTTVCCAPGEGCCAGAGGPYCCDRGYTAQPAVPVQPGYTVPPSPGDRWD